VADVLKHVVLGHKVWGRFESRKTGALYLDLEQDEQAAADRWKAILGDHRPTNLHIAFSWPILDHGGIDELRRFLLGHADIGLVVIDTWAMFHPQNASGTRAGLNAYYQEYDHMGVLKSIANEFGIGIIIVHHFSKDKERPSGTAAMEGAPDGEWDLHRESKSKLAILDIRGKNVPETRVYFEVDLRTSTWLVTNVE
jgi:hypothetical protein